MTAPSDGNMMFTVGGVSVPGMAMTSNNESAMGASISAGLVSVLSRHATGA